MEITTPEPIVSVFSVLPELGFWPIEDALSIGGVSWVLKGRCFDVKASRLTNMYLREEVLCSGILKTARSFGMIEFSMPVAMESKEQVMAWLAYGIKAEAILHDPLIPWAQKALELNHLLPWERHYTKIREEAAQRRKLWRERPYCVVERKWIKAVLGFLQEQASKNPEGEFSIMFDGEMLSVRVGRIPLGVPAEGPSSWNERYRQSLNQLASIPARIMSDPVEMGIWQGDLRLDHGGQRWVSRRRSANQPLGEQETVQS